MDDGINELSSDVIPLPIVIFVKLSQRENASSPIEVTLPGIVILVKSMQ